MATAQQIHNLRSRINDLNDKITNQPLDPSKRAFTDDELINIIDDAASEASNGAATAEQLNPLQSARMILLARADAILQIAQDESRRIKWAANQESIDPSSIAENLISVAKELRERYNEALDRDLRAKIAGVANPTSTGGVMNFNDTVRPHSERNFNNRTVRRNTSSDH